MAKLKIKEIDDRAQVVDRERRAVQARRENARAIINAHSQVMASLTSQMEATSLDDEWGYEALRREQEMAWARYEQAWRELEDCDRIEEGLNRDAGELIEQAQSYIVDADAQVQRAYLAQAQSPYGRDSINALAKTINAKREQADQVIRLLGGSASIARLEDLPAGSAPARYFSDYQDLVYSAGVGDVEGVLGEPTIEERRQAVAFVNASYAAQLAASVHAHADEGELAQAQDSNAVGLLKEAYAQTGVNALWSEEEARLQHIDNELVELRDSRRQLIQEKAAEERKRLAESAASFQELVEPEAVAAPLEKTRGGMPAVSTARNVDSEDIVDAWKTASTDYCRVLSDPRLDDESFNELYESYRRQLEAFGSTLLASDEEGADWPALQTIGTNHQAVERLNAERGGGQTELMMLNVQKFAPMKLAEDNFDEALAFSNGTMNTDAELEVIRDMERKGEFDGIDGAASITTDMRIMEPRWREPRLPTVKAGVFKGASGDSGFIPHSEEARNALSRFGKDSIEYRNGYPDFAPFSTHDTPFGVIDFQVEIGHMTGDRENGAWEFGVRPKDGGYDRSYDLGNFRQADLAIAERIVTGSSVTPLGISGEERAHIVAVAKEITAFRKEKGLTWHECADGKTMQLVPREIHASAPHSGGVSLKKYVASLGFAGADW